MNKKQIRLITILVMLLNIATFYFGNKMDWEAYSPPVGETFKYMVGIMLALITICVDIYVSVFGGIWLFDWLGKK